MKRALIFFGSFILFWFLVITMSGDIVHRSSKRNYITWDTVRWSCIKMPGRNLPVIVHPDSLRTRVDNLIDTGDYLFQLKVCKQQGLCSCDTVKISVKPGYVLDLVVQSFNVKCPERKLELDAVYDNELFTLYHSKDGFYFEYDTALNLLQGKNDITLNDWSFYRFEVMHGTDLFRSQIIKNCMQDDREFFEIYYNQLSRVCHLYYSTQYSFNFRVYDVLGRKVFDRSYLASVKGSDNITLTLRSGVYLLVCENHFGRRSFKKIVAL